MSLLPEIATHGIPILHIHPCRLSCVLNVLFIAGVCNSMQYAGGLFNILSEHYRIHSGVGCISDGRSPLYHGNGCICRLFLATSRVAWRTDGVYLMFVYGSNTKNIDHCRKAFFALSASVNKCSPCETLNLTCALHNFPPLRLSTSTTS
jgi:hypothetical protein